MPAVVSNAVCGPQVPGTPIAPAGTNLSTLNGCPLNACCDIWGQCGTTVEFCTISESPTGAPGTAAVGTNGCISNCGTAIITGSAPAEVLKVGFFEGYNLDRPCINMPITSFNMVGYTDIYLAFAALTTDFAVDISAIEEQFEMFLSMSGFKKVLSIGGWSFSTDPSTYSIFREAVTEANMATTVANIVSFVSTYGLDGINIDWEYPAEVSRLLFVSRTLTQSLYISIYALLQLEHLSEKRYSLLLLCSFLKRANY
jgi:chitinase